MITLVNKMNLAFDYAWIPWLIVFCYFILLKLGTYYMSHRQIAFKLRGVAMIWNGMLAVFSMLGFYFTLPITLEAFMYAPKIGLCSSYYELEKAEPWITLFMLSKIPELLDTVFLILRKKNPSFLHVFHHSSVLIYSWTAYSLYSPLGLYFTAMNYGVHALMYSYYFLTEYYQSPLTWGIMVTYIQIIQMIIGTLLTCVAFYLQCESTLSLCAAFILYATYFKLFLNFLFEKYKKQTTLKV